MTNVILSGIGSYIPTQTVQNKDFLQTSFYEVNGEKITLDNETIIRKFNAITGIDERRYAEPNQVSSDLALIAAQRAIADAGCDKESIDTIIYAHNFGDVAFEKVQSDVLPSLASRVKHALGIKNNNCNAYDLLAGCPGWIQGVIVARQALLSGDAKRVLVIGAETLSRVVDPHDRDQMIYADGAGAAIVETEESETKRGILSVASQTFTEQEAFYLYYGCSNQKDFLPENNYIKMDGRKIYEFALTNVPKAMQICLEKANISIDELAKVFLHQANEKMDEAIINRFYKLYDKATPENIMPMSIQLLGNSSVATVPTLYDMVLQGKLSGHQVNAGDKVLFASVGAGMNINAFSYQL